ncbi:NAD-dependent epimerase/dehydratase family protein [Amycolatopsis suaedae]|uniref:SDR family epimerase/dehydratase n=1 Tax=Amycolatopsis suaedae TaxID=2510978 RepID=A0A4Q7J6V7_9PSEU|nr:NAD-dependent epimerase/dehydratase [Amycolatopsis suaedae]RZQ62512.1 SDR family epimerase/dehydratase [Amycolatopsis suaedae]
MAHRPLIVVLGASGLLGTAVARELSDRPVRLRLVARRGGSAPPGGRADVEARAADLTEPGVLAAAVEGADAVLHLVAHIAGETTWRVSAHDSVAERINQGLAFDLVDAVRAGRPKRPPLVVFAGSMSQAGRAVSGRLDGTEPDRPLTVYDEHKLAAERALKDATADGTIRSVSLRLATLFSRGTDPVALDRGVVAAMMRRAFAGKPLTLWNDGTVKRDLLCVDDAAAAFTAALDRADELTGGHWLVGTGQATRVGDLFGSIAKLVATATGRPPVPVNSVVPAMAGATDTLDFVVDPRRFTEASGWSARQRLHEALESTAAAFARTIESQKEPT